MRLKNNLIINYDLILNYFISIKNNKMEAGVYESKVV